MAGRGNPNWKPGVSGNPNGKAKGQHYISEAIRRIGDHAKITECEVRERFRILNEYHHWYNVVLSQEGFPDFVLEKDSGIFRVEVETNSRNFIAHKHDISLCDMIICWHNNWADCTIPIIDISLEWINYCAMKKAKPFCEIDNSFRTNG